MTARKHKTGLAANAASDYITRLAISRLAGLTFEGSRDLIATLGYNPSPSAQEYQAQYEFNGIAERVIEAFPNATWRTPPALTDDADAEAETPFEKAWASLEKRFGISRLLRRADCLDGLGRYAVILIGLSGEQNLSMPAGKGKLIYLQAYGERRATITAWDTDPASPRFGLPQSYSINTGTLAATSMVNVHWTRAVHVAEGCIEDEVYGKPRLRGIYNWLQDTVKCIGGSAEMFWRGAAPGLHFDLDKERPTPTDDELATMKTQVDDYVHGLQRTIRTQGVSVNELGKMIQEPTGLFQALMQLISGTTGIPARILLGSERGELASTSDDDNWKDRVAERQETHAGPMILRPLVERLIQCGALPQPKGGDFDIEWPDLKALTDENWVDIALKAAQALNTYAQGPAEMICPPQEFREVYMGLEPEPPGGFPEDNEPPLDEGGAEGDPQAGLYGEGEGAGGGEGEGEGEAPPEPGKAGAIKGALVI